jgi:hypothetical protein
MDEICLVVFPVTGFGFMSKFLVSEQRGIGYLNETQTIRE